MSWLTRCINVFRSGRVTDELDQELQFHLESRARDLMASGVQRDEAFLEAERRLGNAGVLRERSRDVKLLPWLDAIARDLRMGLRMLRRDLLVSSAAITSLALAIGGCSAAFALVDALILRPLPVRGPPPSMDPSGPASDRWKSIRSWIEREANAVTVSGPVSTSSPGRKEFGANVATHGSQASSSRSITPTWFDGVTASSQVGTGHDGSVRARSSSS